jgi:hypothetical protein
MDGYSYWWVANDLDSKIEDIIGLKRLFKCIDLGLFRFIYSYFILIK